jgi:single-strand DNA-binding protein
MNQHPHSIRRAICYCGGMTFCVDRLLFSGTALGFSVALAARRRSALASATPAGQLRARRGPHLRHPSGLGFQRRISRAAYARLQPTCGEIFLRTLHRKRVLTLGAGPCARLRPVCPEQIRRPNTEEIIMYRNSVSLIGFAGKDAEPRTTNNQTPYTVLSLATQSSYKDKKTGEYINRTEWHRVIGWGKLGEFALKIQKGAHLAVEGKLVSREFPDKKHNDVKHRIWEIRATSILKLDRAEKAPVDEQTDDVEATEEVPD